MAFSFAMPANYRALASPVTREPIVRKPKRGASALQGPGAYLALLHLLTYRLGSFNPGAGLRWWYEAGWPVPDRALEFA